MCACNLLELGMFGKLSKNACVKNVLVISLTNVGDVVLTCPVIDVLLRDFPGARLHVIVGPKAGTLFEGHPRIETIVYDKHSFWVEQCRWFAGLRRRRFDAIVDLRQSALGLFLPARWQTPVGPTYFNGHMRFKHLERLKAMYPDFQLPVLAQAIIPRPMPALAGIGPYTVIAPGAADSAKRWSPSGFASAADHLALLGRAVVFVGDAREARMVKDIQAAMKNPSLSLAGKTDLRELAFVVQHAACVLTNDSGTMHLASYLNAPVVALWGPTDMVKYSPWSSKCVTVFRQKDMTSIHVEDVTNAIAGVQ